MTARVIRDFESREEEEKTMKTTVKVLAVGIALIATTSGCRSFTGRSLGEIFDNKTMVGTVKTKLVRDRVQNLTWVNVDAKDGVVYLTGNAETAAQKARATELAQETNGVKRVVNDIVVNSARTDSASASARPAPAASTTSSSASSTARSSTTSPAASPATTSSSRASAGTITGEVLTVDQGTGNVTLRMAGGSDLQLRLPPSSVRNVKPGDRLSVSVNSVAR
jgi:hyperosmotically inducible periplasmic protein